MQIKEYALSLFVLRYVAKVPDMLNFYMQGESQQALLAKKRLQGRTNRICLLYGLRTSILEMKTLHTPKRQQGRHKEQVHNTQSKSSKSHVKKAQNSSFVQKAEVHRL